MLIIFGVVEKPNLKKSKKAKALAIDGSGNTYVTGHSQGVDTGINDYATIKYDSDGTDAWVTRYDGQASPVSRRGACGIRPELRRFCLFKIGPFYKI